LTGAEYQTKTTDMQALTPAMIRDWPAKEAAAPVVPERGIAIYVEGESSPACLDTREEFILGRQAGPNEEALVDLGPFRAYSLGLSRRHASIRRTRDGYEVTDLGSVNGTWLNEERLPPHTPYPLPSGSQLRLSSMRVLVLYRPFTDMEEKR
jgi:hypothetical protein